MRGLTWALTTALALGAGLTHADDPTVGWYRFEEGQVGDEVSGNTRVPDAGPNGLDGWTPYDCHAKRVPGIAPGSRIAWDVSGLNDWFLVPDDPKLAIDGSLTLEAWVQIRNYQRTAVSNFIVFRGDSTPGWDAYSLALSPAGDLLFHIEGPGVARGDPPATVRCPFVWFGTAVHVAGVFNAETGSLELYVDGECMATMATRARPRAALNPAMGPGVGVGGYHGGGPGSFAIDGIIDEVRISAAALGPDDMLCGDVATLAWVGTPGFEQDGVDPDCGGQDGAFLFAVRCVPAGDRDCRIRLELRRNGQREDAVSMSRAQGAPGSEAPVYRARVGLDEGRWEYRFVADAPARGAPTRWHDGPVVSVAPRE